MNSLAVKSTSHEHFITRKKNEFSFQNNYKKYFSQIIPNVVNHWFWYPKQTFAREKNGLKTWSNQKKKDRHSTQQDQHISLFIDKGFVRWDVTLLCKNKTTKSKSYHNTQSN